MKIMHFIAASAIVLGAATSARAADAVYEEPTPEYMPPVFSWTGAYLGGQVGYGWGRSKFSAYDEDLGADSSTLKSKGFVGGVFAGYNWEAGNGFLVGADADFNYARVKKSNDDFDDEDGYASAETKLGWLGAVRGRVGYAVDRFLPYVAGGVAFGEVKHSFEEIDVTEPAHYTADFKKTQVGWTVGGGVDYAATDNIFLRLEYRYTDLGKKTYHISDDSSFKTDFTMHEVRVGVAYKF
ncbi:outer membrane protein [Brucella endophytica]|uniref:Outer membrane protein n=1 Tax=Brucella endophytica TaxID=1963359 RepID=A0A916WDE4_9HYPH|nr:outer membrane protein [Brucella endophytica]GGA88504.1 outer membrane protein [Brucella endophytica]